MTENTPATSSPLAVVNPVDQLEAQWKLAQRLAKSPLLPQSYFGTKARRYSPEEVASNVFLAMQLGHELGFGPMQSIQSISVINNQPALYGDGLLALVQASGLLEDFSETGDDKEWTCVVKRKGMKAHTVVYTRADAENAHLIPDDVRSPWHRHPARMLQMRARSRALRDRFADVVKGLRDLEEAMDAAVIETVNEPAPPPAIDHKPEGSQFNIKENKEPDIDDEEVWFNHGKAAYFNGKKQYDFPADLRSAKMRQAFRDGWEEASNETLSEQPVSQPEDEPESEFQDADFDEETGEVVENDSQEEDLAQFEIVPDMDGKRVLWKPFHVQMMKEIRACQTRSSVSLLAQANDKWIERFARESRPGPKNNPDVFKEKAAEIRQAINDRIEELPD